MAAQTVLSRIATLRPGPSLDRLWQVPVFFAGLLAFISLVLTRPLWHDDGPRQIEREFAAARQLLEQPHADPDRLQALAQRLLEHAEKHCPQRAGEAQFLVGSAYVRQAGRAETAVAAGHWSKARWHLEQAEALGVPEADRARLRYRLGLSWFYTSADLRRTTAYLASSVEEVAGDQAEGYALLVQAHLRLPEPDLRAALHANQKLLALPTHNDETLAAARLARGEILLRLHEPAEARKVLERIGAGAPPALAFRARLLAAESCQQEELWADALRWWTDALRFPREASGEMGRILFNLGLCASLAGMPARAEEAWERARNHGGDEGQAAALKLADLRLQGRNPAAALPDLEWALRQVATPKDYHNALVDLEEAQGLFEQGFQVFLGAGEFAHAQQLARVYERLAPPGTAQNLFGQATEAWARKRQEQARRIRQAETAQRETQAAAALFQEAGAAFESAAAQVQSQPELSEALWRSGECYLQGQDPTRAVAVLARFVALEAPADRLGEGWYRLAEAHRGLALQATVDLFPGSLTPALALAAAQRAFHHDGAADSAYQRAIEYPGPFGYQARYQRALVQLAYGRPENAVKALRQNLDLLPKDPNREENEDAYQETYDKSLFALTNLYFQIRSFNEAHFWLKLTLQERYQGKAEALLARDQIAFCCRVFAAREDEILRRADQSTTPAAQDYHRQAARHWREQAANHYRVLVQDLTRRQGDGTLAPWEEALLLKAEFAEVDCRFELAQWEEAIRLCQVLAARYRNRTEKLEALLMIYRCQNLLGLREKAQGLPDSKHFGLAQQTLQQVREALETLSDAAFQEPPATRTRQGWKEVIEKTVAAYTLAPGRETASPGERGEKTPRTGRDDPKAPAPPRPTGKGK
jgi:hypothetical protein